MRFDTADEEMRRAYGKAEGECRDCKNRDGNYCGLTTRRRKCSDYGQACGRFADAGKYKFVVR